MLFRNRQHQQDNKVLYYVHSLGTVAGVSVILDTGTLIHMGQYPIINILSISI